MSSRFFATLFIVFVCLEAKSQNSASSPYSAYGLGIINNRTSSLNRGLGGTGIGLQDDSNLNTLNPASYVSIKAPVSHVFEFSIYGEHTQYTTTNASVSGTNGGLSNINYWFKFKPWWASTLGLSPFSSVSYEVTTRRTIAATAETAYQYAGSGNISELYWGNGFKVYKNLSAGVNFSYIFGSVNRSEAVAASAYNEALTLNNRIFTNKMTLDYGLQYKINLNDRRSIVVGATYAHGMNLRGKRDLTLYNSEGDTLTNFTANNTRYQLPASAGLGVSYRTKFSVFAADAVFKQWSQAKFSEQALPFQDTWRLSLGYQFLGNENAENYLGFISLKAGIYAQNHYMSVNGNDILDYGMSLGAGFPVLDGKSTINLTYNYDRFGTLKDDLILQKSQKFMVEVVIRDLWGYKRRFD